MERYRTLDLEVLPREVVEVCPLEAACGRDDCYKFVYQNYEDCPRYERLEHRMLADSKRRKDYVHVSRSPLLGLPELGRMRRGGK